MNYYDARQRQSDQKWDFTCHNRRTGTWAVGKCADHQCHHDTPEEARECDVEGCDFDTNRAAEAGPYFYWALCSQHMNKETVASLLKVGSFMGSW